MADFGGKGAFEAVGLHAVAPLSFRESPRAILKPLRKSAFFRSGIQRTRWRSSRRPYEYRELCGRLLRPVRRHLAWRECTRCGPPRPSVRLQLSTNSSGSWRQARRPSVLLLSMPPQEYAEECPILETAPSVHSVRRFLLWFFLLVVCFGCCFFSVVCRLLLRVAVL